MPDIRPFRALRYDPAKVGDVARLVAPPYDVIDAAHAQRLLERDPHNAVRLDLPLPEPGDEPGDQYRRAARTLAAWRSDGSVRKDREPAVYVYEQRFRVPGTDLERIAIGLFGRLCLEAFGPGSGVLPHERTMPGPKEDRYRLLRATGVNTSPVVLLAEDPDDDLRGRLEQAAAGDPEVAVVDDDGVRHRMWVVPADAGGRELATLVGRSPVVIADGHHRYETAIRYRDERRMTRSCEPDPPFDFVFALVMPTTASPTVLPTHRLLRGLGDAGVERLVAGIAGSAQTTAADPDDLVLRYQAAATLPGGWGRFGLLARAGAWDVQLTPSPEALAPVERLDVTQLARLLERYAGIDAEATAQGSRVVYTKSAKEAAAAVARGIHGVDAAVLLEPTPVRDVIAVAKAGEVMPQKSTYFYPKALTGLLFNPHEW